MVDGPINISTFVAGANQRLDIFGLDALVDAMPEVLDLVYNLIVAGDALVVNLYYESDAELYSLSLLDGVLSSDVDSRYFLKTQKKQRVVGANPETSIYSRFVQQGKREGLDESAFSRFSAKQFNLRMPAACIRADSDIAYYVGGICDPEPQYFLAPSGSKAYANLNALLDTITSPNRYADFITDIGDDFIEMYDKDGIPRGVFPRQAFYSTEYYRHTVWGLVFNRVGELLLHKRSQETKDNRLLWDKSIGGHIDLSDTSTFMTAKRELVEELYLPKAELTKYMRADLGDIVSFGDWNRRKRPEDTFRAQFESLGQSDWVMFRATDRNGVPLTHDGPSVRRLQRGDRVEDVPAMFRSDIYVFIAPRNLLDSDSQMRKVVRVSETSGVSSDHKLVRPGQLRTWITEERARGTDKEVFTSDLITIDQSYRYVLDEISEFVRRLP